MLQQLRNRWVQTGTLTVVAAVVGVVVSILVFSASSEETLSSGQLIFASGGASGAGIGAPNIHLPVTAAEAVASGWKDPILCAAGRGRYFQQDQPDEGVPYILMYNQGNRLIGFYLYSKAEMPQPWERTDRLQGSGGTALLDFKHWGLFVYTEDSTRACTKSGESTEEVAGGAAGLRDELRWRTAAERSTPTPYVPPTPTPTTGVVLADGANRMAALKSLSFTLVVGEGGGPLMAGMAANKIEGDVVLPDQVTIQITEPGGEPQPAPPDSVPFRFDGLAATLADILGALQDPSDAPRLWINNVPSRGFSGSVSGEQLTSLIPTAIPDATVTVSVWLGQDGLVRRIEFQGPVAPDDAPEAVRVLELNGFDQQ